MGVRGPLSLQGERARERVLMGRRVVMGVRGPLSLQGERVLRIPVGGVMRCVVPSPYKGRGLGRGFPRSPGARTTSNTPAMFRASARRCSTPAARDGLPLRAIAPPLIIRGGLRLVVPAVQLHDELRCRRDKVHYVGPPMGQPGGGTCSRQAAWPAPGSRTRAPRPSNHGEGCGLCVRCPSTECTAAPRPTAWSPLPTRGEG